MDRYSEDDVQEFLRGYRRTTIETACFQTRRQRERPGLAIWLHQGGVWRMVDDDLVDQLWAAGRPDRSLCRLLLRKVLRLSAAQYEEVRATLMATSGLPGIYKARDAKDYAMVIELPDDSTLGRNLMIAGGSVTAALVAAGLYKYRHRFREGSKNQAAKTLEENSSDRSVLGIASSAPSPSKDLDAEGQDRDGRPSITPRKKVRATGGRWFNFFPGQSDGPNASQGIFPASLQNEGTSCYFNAVALLLYQMRDVLPKMSCSRDKTAEMIQHLITLTNKMARQPAVVDRQDSGPVYQQSKSLLRDSQAHQDASEFMLLLFNDCIVDRALVGVDFTHQIRKSQQRIESLTCGGTQVPDHAVQDFQQRWPKILETPNSVKSLAGYTFDSRTTFKIQPIVQGECEIHRGEPNSNFDSVHVDWFNIALENGDMQHANILIIDEILSGHVNVCLKIQTDLKHESSSVIGAVHKPQDLFNVYALKTSFYLPPTSKYIITAFKWVAGRRATFEYGSEILDFGTNQYELICVVYRPGYEQECGHYFASLKIKGTWYLYNDAPLTRTPSPLSTTDFPYLLLFRITS
jgi:hypothetical protein